MDFNILLTRFVIFNCLCTTLKNIKIRISKHKRRERNSLNIGDYFIIKQWWKLHILTKKTKHIAVVQRNMATTTRGGKIQHDRETDMKKYELRSGFLYFGLGIIYLKHSGRGQVDPVYPNPTRNIYIYNNRNLHTFVICLYIIKTNLST